MLGIKIFVWIQTFRRSPFAAFAHPLPSCHFVRFLTKFFQEKPLLTLQSKAYQTTRNVCAFVYFLEAIVNKSLQESQLSWISLKSQPWSFPPQCFIILVHLPPQSLNLLTFSIPSPLCSCLSTKRCQPLEKHFQVSQLWRLPEVSSLSEFLPKGDWLSGHVPSFHVLLDVKQQEVEAERAFCWGCSARSWQSTL